MQLVAADHPVTNKQVCVSLSSFVALHGQEAATGKTNTLQLQGPRYLSEVLEVLKLSSAPSQQGVWLQMVCRSQMWSF